MNKRDFLKSLELIKLNLVNQDVKKVFNSIGSNIFFEFGKDIETSLLNGKKDLLKEWIIWIGNASWRITKQGRYIVGSGDNSQTISANIQQLMGKRFQFFQILSRFFDIDFTFEDGYQLTTFFNWVEENQWTVFLPDQTEISIDFSNKEVIKNIKEIADCLLIKENYKHLDLPIMDVVVRNINYDKADLPTIHLKNDIFISLEICTWRLEKDNEYCIGYLDENKEEVKNKLSKIIGKRIKRVDVANSMMDARFQFEDQYVLKTFSCCRTVSQWGVYSKKGALFHANIPIADK